MFESLGSGPPWGRECLGQSDELVVPMTHTAFTVRMTGILDRFEVTQVSIERLCLSLASFVSADTDEQRLAIMAILDEIGLPPDHTKSIVERTTISVSPRVGNKQSDLLKIYRFHALEQVAGGEPIVIYSHGGTIRTDPTLHSVYFPALAALLSRRGANWHFVAVDHRGGHCQADMRRFCLEDRVHDLVLTYGAIARVLFAQGLDTSMGPVFLIGNSMGGHVVAMAAELLAARGIALVTPAAYSEKAHFAQLGADFRREVRKADSWMASPVFGALEGYLARGGHAIMRAAAFDDVIPVELTNRYAECIRAARSRHNEATIAPVDHLTMVADDVSRVADFILGLVNPPECP